MARSNPQVNIRIPEDLMYWVRKTAKENERSITGQIVIALKNAKKEEENARKLNQ